MLAKEIIEDSLLPFLSKEASDIEVDEKAGSQKVNFSVLGIYQIDFLFIS